MLGPFQLAQLAFAAFVIAVIAERVRYLYLGALVSEAGLRWVLRAIDAGDGDALGRFARARPSSHIGRLIAARREDGEGDADELLIDLGDAASARLLLIRVSATLASTTGLLGGILALARGSGTGLAALAAGGAERQNLDEAIVTMAIGVALSALCFQALALLRPAAQKLVTQTAQVARALSAHPSLKGGSIPPVEPG